MQNNALTSWARLGLNVLVLGNDPGTAEISRQLGFTHLPSVRCNSQGTPLLSSLFDTAKESSNTDYLAYLNADIILQPDFQQAILNLIRQIKAGQDILLSCRRMNIPLNERLPLSDSACNKKLDKLKETYGSWDASNAVDLFLFNRDLFEAIPDFAIGRMQWDNWLLWQGKERGASIIDATEDITLLHPIHGYAEHTAGWQEITQGREAQHNRELASGHQLNLADACTHYMSRGVIKGKSNSIVQNTSTLFSANPEKELKGCLHYLATDIDSRDYRYTVDGCRTLLWRNKAYFPTYESLHWNNRLLGQAVMNASDLAKEGKLSEALQSIQDFLCRGLLQTLQTSNEVGKKLVLWGGGELGRRALDLLNRHNILVSGFIDQDTSKQGKLIDGIPVIAMDISQVENMANCFILVSSMYQSEIISELENLGLSFGKHFTA